MGLYLIFCFSSLQSAPFITTEHNRFSGYCVDVLNEIKARTALNYSLYLVEDGHYGPRIYRSGPLVGMIADVLSKKADFAVGDLTVNEFREQYVAFTEPIFTFSIAGLVRKELAPNFHTLDDLATKSNLSVGAYSGSIIIRQLNALRASRTPRWLIEQISRRESTGGLVADEAEALAAVRSQPFVLLREEPKNTFAASRDCSLKVLTDPNFYITSHYAIAFRKQSPYLKLFNRAIKELKAKGILEKLKRKHFAVGCLKSGAAAAATTVTNVSSNLAVLVVTCFSSALFMMNRFFLF